MTTLTRLERNAPGGIFDEFGEKGVKPHSLKRQNGHAWRGCGPRYDGEPTACFDGGYLFRIANEKEKKWAFYNDTSMFEMHVEFTFGGGSCLEALENTQIKRKENGEFLATTVVYPLETVMFVSGTWNGYRSHFEGRPLSQAYLERAAQSTQDTLEKAINEIKRISPQEDDAEATLKACLSRRILFVDPEFPPTHNSLDSGKGLITALPWYRPSEYLPEYFAKNVALFRMPITAFSMERGELSDSWVVSAMAALAEHPEYIKRMFRHPSNPKNTAEEFSIGAYRVLLNKDGMWKSYLVDNYLPVVGGAPRFAHNKNDPCEMWVSVLEKAYAKRNGSFANIASGDPLMALRDFTGCPTTRLDALFVESFHNSEKSDDFFTRLLMLCSAGHIILFSTSGGDLNSTQLAKYKEAGIAIGYALSVLNVQYINGYKLFRLRNPWNNGVQWKGNWGPSSSLWKEDPDVAAECTDHDGSDGSLWMNWDDVKKYFIGCGVAFNFFDHCDYRIPGMFTKVIPNVCLKISVSSPTIMSLILSQQDHFGTEKELEDYDPIMLSVAYSEYNNDEFTVFSNTSADPENPNNRYVFLHGRDVSMIYEFLPERSPYLVLPRRMQTNDNDEETVLPFHLGILSPAPITDRGDVRVSFKALPANNEVFENYPHFTNGGEAVSLTYQVKYANSHLESVTADHIRE